MSWFRIDDKMAFHAKIVAAGNEAVGAWVRAGAWSCDQLTNGVVPKANALVIAPERTWRRLVEARLVDLHPDGYELHDFLNYNPSAAAVRAERGATSEARRRAGAAGGKRSGEVRRSKTEANGEANGEAKPKQNEAPIPIPIPIPDQTPKPPSGAPCVFVSDEPGKPVADDPTPVVVPTRDHEPAEWRANQTTDDGVLGMLDGVYAMGLREGRPRQPVTGIRNRNDTAALRKVCGAHGLGVDGEPLRGQALLDWTRAAAAEFSRTRPDTLTPTVNAFAGWLDRQRKHFDARPGVRPAEANAPAQPRAFAKDPPRPAPTGNASGILDLIESEDADCSAGTGARSDVRGRDAPEDVRGEIGTSQGNVDGIAKRVGGAR